MAASFQVTRLQYLNALMASRIQNSPQSPEAVDLKIIPSSQTKLLNDKNAAAGGPFHLWGKRLGPSPDLTTVWLLAAPRADGGSLCPRELAASSGTEEGSEKGRAKGWWAP